MHRLVYVAFHGPIELGRVVRHKCDVRNCINPDHLELGSYQDNSNDMKDRGRTDGPAGTRNTHAKMTEEKVKTARWLHDVAGASVGELCSIFPVKELAMSNILARQSWTHV